MAGARRNGRGMDVKKLGQAYLWLGKDAAGVHAHHGVQTSIEDDGRQPEGEDGKMMGPNRWVSSPW